MTTPGDVTGLWAEDQVTRLLDGQDPKARLPKYGSAAWQQLRGDDPQKAAAILTAAEMWRRYGDEEDLLAWFRDATAPKLAHWQGRTHAELAEARKPKPPRQMQATPGWPPIAIPGRPGWWRHCIDGQQVDLPHNAQESAA